MDLNHYRIVVPLFGAANAAPNKSSTILYLFYCTNFSILNFSQSSITEVEFNI